MLLQHFGAKLTSSFYTDSVSTSQHLKNVSYRSYDLAHCKNHRRFKVPQLAKHHNDTRPFIHRRATKTRNIFYLRLTAILAAMPVVSFAVEIVACEVQTHFRSRSDDRKCVCASQAIEIAVKR